MLHAGSIVGGKVTALLSGETGLNAVIAEASALTGVTAAPVTTKQIVARNISPDIADKSTTTKYPVLHIYCERIVNSMREKGRMFSGEAQMCVEARVSHDRVDALETQLETYVSAITQVLQENKGDWGDGAYYTGGYEVVFGAVKHGGRNFLQAAKVTFTVQVSR